MCRLVSLSNVEDTFLLCFSLNWGFLQISQSLIFLFNNHTSRMDQPQLNNSDRRGGEDAGTDLTKNKGNRLRQQQLPLV